MFRGYKLSRKETVRKVFADLIFAEEQPFAACMHACDIIFLISENRKHLHAYPRAYGMYMYVLTQDMQSQCHQ